MNHIGLLKFALLLLVIAYGVHSFVFVWDCRSETEILLLEPYCAEADRLCRFFLSFSSSEFDSNGVLQVKELNDLIIKNLINNCVMKKQNSKVNKYMF